jgi:hypothetical protein
MFFTVDLGANTFESIRFIFGTAFLKHMTFGEWADNFETR